MRTILAGTAAVAVFLVAACTTDTPATTGPATLGTAPTTTQPKTAGPDGHRLGDSADLPAGANTFEVTLLRIVDPDTSDKSKPLEGRRFVSAEFRIVNKGPGTVPVPSNRFHSFGVNMVNASGGVYTPAPGSIDGSIRTAAGPQVELHAEWAPGQPRTGFVTCNVPIDGTVSAVTVSWGRPDRNPAPPIRWQAG